jgi:hypothetical protein
MVALAAAYAVVLQTTLLAISDPLAGTKVFAAASLCAATKGASRQPMPVADGCLAACIACCCTAVAPAVPAPSRYRSTPSCLIGVEMVVVAAALPVGTPGAHRSRGPPLSLKS